jgi:hypothetical protein
MKVALLLLNMEFIRFSRSAISQWALMALMREQIAERLAPAESLFGAFSESDSLLLQAHVLRR